MLCLLVDNISNFSFFPGFKVQYSTFLGDVQQREKYLWVCHLKIKSCPVAACVGLDMSLQNPCKSLCVGVGSCAVFCVIRSQTQNWRSGGKQRCSHSWWLIHHEVWAELLPFPALYQANNILLTLKIRNTRWEHLAVQVRQSVCSCYKRRITVL